MIGKSSAVRRSRSFDGQKDVGTFLISDRLKHTVDFKSKAMKPNVRGDVIQEPLVTLPELFLRLPLSLGFNIEISELRQPRFDSFTLMNITRVPKASRGP